MRRGEGGRETSTNPFREVQLQARGGGRLRGNKPLRGRGREDEDEDEDYEDEDGLRQRLSAAARTEGGASYS